MLKYLVAAGALVLAGVPAAVGLAGNDSFSHDVPVRVPQQAQTAPVDPTAASDDDGTTDRGPVGAEPGDDHGGAVPRDDRTEAADDHGDDVGEDVGDDHGGTTGTHDVGDDHGGTTDTTGTHDAGDDHGGTSGTSGSTSSDSGSSSGGSGSDDGSGGGSGGSGSGSDDGSGHD